MRKQRATKRKVAPDTKYNSKVVAIFVNMIMKKGKKSVAERIVYGSFNIINERVKKDPLEVLQGAVDNVKPLLEVKSRRVGGATYQVPVEVSSARGVTLALRWMRNFALSKKGRPMEERLADEIIDAFNKQGSSIKKREDTHKMAEANKAFAHYRW